jgi:hypothetical protein
MDVRAVQLYVPLSFRIRPRWCPSQWRQRWLVASTSYLARDRIPATQPVQRLEKRALFPGKGEKGRSVGLTPRRGTGLLNGRFAAHPAPVTASRSSLALKEGKKKEKKRKNKNP